MYLFIRALPIVSAIAFGVTLEIWIARPEWAYYIFAVVACIILLSLWLITSRKERGRNFLNFVTTPLIYALGSSAFLLLLNTALIKHLYVIAAVVLYMLVLQNIYAFIYRSDRYQPYALENIYSYINLISLFLFYATAYGITLLLGWPFWYFLAPIFLITSFLFLRTLWSYKVEWNSGRSHIFIIGLLVTEAAYAVHLFPTGPILNGFILTVVYYFCMSVFKDQLRGTLSYKASRLYIILSICALIVAFASTRWT